MVKMHDPLLFVADASINELVDFGLRPAHIEEINNMIIEKSKAREEKIKSGFEHILKNDIIQYLDEFYPGQNLSLKLTPGNYAVMAKTIRQYVERTVNDLQFFGENYIK